MKKSYESTVMRMAGNIAPVIITAFEGATSDGNWITTNVARVSVAYARAIVAEVLRTEEAAE